MEQPSPSATLADNTSTIPTVPVAAYTNAPFVRLSMAVDMTFENWIEWLRAMCTDQAAVNTVTEGKAREIWDRRLSHFFDALQNPTTKSAPESIWVDSQAQIDGISVKWLDNPAVMVTDVWSSIGFIMSAAASCDTTQGEPSGNRPRDWYVELLIVFTLVIRKVVAKKKIWNTVPNVVHILWSESGNTQPLLQPELDSAASDTSNPSAPATPNIINKDLPSDPLMSSGAEPNIESRHATLQIPGTSRTTPHPATSTPRHAMGATPPTRSPYVETLKDFQKDQIEKALQRLGPEVKDRVIETVQTLRNHGNLGRCAETFPYLCIVYGGLEPRQVCGLALNPWRLDRPPARKVQSDNPGNSTYWLHHWHKMAFIPACQVCGTLLSGIGIDYLQYRRKWRSTLTAKLYSWKTAKSDDEANESV